MEKHHCHSKEMNDFKRKIEYLENADRNKNFTAEELLQMIPVKKSDSILDLGAGTGYLSIPAAKIVDNTVYALDLDSKMLDFIESKARDRKITNIKSLQGSIDNIPLSENSIDIILASLVLHEVNPLSKSLEQIKRVLKEGGYFLCLEFEKKELNSGHKAPPRIHSSEMEQELINAGFSIEKRLSLDDSLYIFIAQK
ncbi:class I SAM-dependent methyltransferase [Clostridium tertium]|uniref:class I SAM-dependent methyltransferase n=1 Tax=Clostridium tertium TaxID=1559 RepID=UPI0024B3C0BA|nr:class I SAM-dependent methyltransferase [Clostridium tertium]MDI9215695.1 class I SAM-dependent methyltransferase [Clostridium tertium]